jgi:5-methyltetrahydropteroyltriglutamate--homocysteine methyltransferase
LPARNKPPFRADHVGSLLRPKSLLRAREEAASGAISQDELRAQEDDAIRNVIKLEQDVGLRSVTDGELRRASWHMDFIYQIAGVERVEQKLQSVFHNPQGDIYFTPSAVRISGKIGMDHTIFGPAFEFLRDTVRASQAGGTPKLTIPAPSLVHYRNGPAAIDHDVYPDMELFWDDVGAAYADEVRRLGELGCTYLQFDDTSLAYLNDPEQREMFTKRGEDPAHQHEIYIRTINRALENKPAGMSVTAHLCRGNYRSSWVAQGGYDYVADALFNDLNIDGYFLEYDDQRSGGFEPLRLVPKGKQVVLGLVTTKRGELEDKDLLKRRLEEASKFIDLDQVCLSPQCGFSSTLEGNALTQDEEIAKLRLVVETAEEVWGSAG